VIPCAVLVVLDTSVIVAAWRSRRGASFALLEQLAEDAFEIALSVPLVLEYEAVLVRHLDSGRSKSDVADLVDYFCSVGVQQRIFFLWRPFLRDPKDDMVAELAVAASAVAVVTHNIRDFAGLERFGILVLTPGQFLRQL
jgi:putative PIN family toxin of toxin-antitoxin system